MTAQANPMSARLVGRSSIQGWRSAVRLGIVLGAVSLAFGTWQFLYTDTLILGWVALAYGAVALLAPLVIAAAGAISTARDVQSDGYPLLILTDLTDGQIVRGYVSAALYRFRGPLAVLAGLMPAVLIEILRVEVQVQAIFANIITCMPGEPCSPPFRAPTMAEWSGGVLGVTAILVGLWGLNLLAASLGVWQALFWRRSAPAATGALSALLVGMVLAVLPPLTMPTSNPLVLGVVLLVAAAVPYLLCGGVLLLARQRVRKGERRYA